MKVPTADFSTVYPYNLCSRVQEHIRHTQHEGTENHIRSRSLDFWKIGVSLYFVYFVLNVLTCWCPDILFCGARLNFTLDAANLGKLYVFCLIILTFIYYCFVNRRFI